MQDKYILSGKLYRVLHWVGTGIGIYYVEGRKPLGSSLLAWVCLSTDRYKACIGELCRGVGVGHDHGRNELLYWYRTLPYRDNLSQKNLGILLSLSLSLLPCCKSAVISKVPKKMINSCSSVMGFGF